MELLRHDFNNWYSQYWKLAADEFMKRLLKGKPIDEYLDEIFAMLNELIDQGRMPIIAASVFGFWCSKVEADILRTVKGEQQAEFRAKSGRGIFERHRKTIKRDLDKYVKAYQVLKELSEKTEYTIAGQTGLAGYLGDNDYTHVHPGFNGMGKMLKELLITNPSLSIEVKNGDDLDEGVKNIYSDYLNVQLSITSPGAKPRKLYFEFRNHDTSLEMIIRYLESAIVHFAYKKFGDDGHMIADMMIDGMMPKHPKKEDIRKPGRPQEVHLDKMILFLDYHDVDEVWVARFINTLENRERYKEMVGGGEWRVRSQKEVSRTESNMRKAIRMRIKKLGGNGLRFDIDQHIKRKKECTDCDWRYNEGGVLIRSVPCKRHLKFPKEIGISMASPNWRENLEKKGLPYYANAITFK
jgi:hypothetical protein